MFQSDLWKGLVDGVGCEDWLKSKLIGWVETVLTGCNLWYFTRRSLRDGVTMMTYEGVCRGCMTLQREGACYHSLMAFISSLSGLNPYIAVKNFCTGPWLAENAMSRPSLVQSDDGV